MYDQFEIVLEILLNASSVLRLLEALRCLLLLTLIIYTQGITFYMRSISANIGAVTSRYP